MSWFQTDDQFPNNRKSRELAERGLEGQLDGLAALGMWNLAGAQCQATGTDGVVKRADAFRLVLNPEFVDHLAGCWWLSVCGMHLAMTARGARRSSRGRGCSTTGSI